eukprot:3304263-Rhodomonas_salina.1
MGCATFLRACYAKPGTDIAYRAICLRACYAKPGTDSAYLARCMLSQPNSQTQQWHSDGDHLRSASYLPGYLARSTWVPSYRSPWVPS